MRPPSRRRPIPIELVIILGLILVNGIFAGSEIAIVSLRRTRLQQLVDEGRRGAQTLAALRGEPERFLATVQVGITIVGTTAAAFGGSTIAVHLEPLIASVPWLADEAEEIAFAAVVALISYLSLVLGELVPKSLALRVGESYALMMAKPLLALSWIAKPVVWLLTASSNVVLRPFRDRTNFMEARISKEEILQMVDEASKAGTLHEHASEIASRALAFDKLPLRDVMIPRDRINPCRRLPPSMRSDSFSSRNAAHASRSTGGHSRTSSGTSAPRISSPSPGKGSWSSSRTSCVR